MPTVIPDASIRDLQLLDEEFTRSIRLRDVSRLVELFYALDAQLQVPGVPPVDGAEAIKRYYAKAFETGLIDLRRESHQFEAENGLACAIGRYSRTCETQPGLLHTGHGHYIAVYRRQDDGRWRAIADSLSPSA
jgi:ketosteroid isomerase-like protein